MRPQTLWISCGVLRAELEMLHRQGKLRGDMLFLGSMLHMNPLVLEETLKREIENQSNSVRPVVLIYGDCSPKMFELIQKNTISRVNAINCAQMLLGTERYRELMHREAFIMLPEWILQWKSIIENELGLSKLIAQELMQEHRKELIYLDTGIIPVPLSVIRECSDYTSLPWSVEKITLMHFLRLLTDAEEIAAGRLPREEET